MASRVCLKSLAKEPKRTVKLSCLILSQTLAIECDAATDLLYTIMDSIHSALLLDNDLFSKSLQIIREKYVNHFVFNAFTGLWIKSCLLVERDYPDLERLVAEVWEMDSFQVEKLETSLKVAKAIGFKADAGVLTKVKERVTGMEGCEQVQELLKGVDL